MAVFGKKLFASSMLLVATSALGAQAPAKPSCDIGEAAKGNLARASLSFNVAQQAATGPSAESNLKSTVKLLESPSQGEDATTRAFILGEALSLWMNQPNVGLTPKRGAVGFTTNPDATIDLIGAVDSLFTIVEAAKPNCHEFTAYYRGGQKFYLDLANSAINSLNADKLDSAEFFATQAHRVFPTSPYGVMVLGNVASKRGDNTKAVQYWRLAADAAAKDTSYRDVHRQMLSSIGAVYLTRANTATGADRLAAARSAAEAFGQLIEVPGTKDSYLYGGRQNYQTALLLSGDTAKFVTTYQPLLQNPSAYVYQDLLNSAVNAARAEKAADAAKLFEATLEQNAYNRDALFNLAVTDLTLEHYDKVGPIVARLVAVDPGNPENYNLAARAYLSLGKAAQARKNTAVAAAYNDSTLTWYTRGNKLPVDVTFSEVTPSEKNLVISGTVVDRRDKIDPANSGAAPVRGKAAKGAKAVPATLPSRAVTLNFEALDKSGAVLGTQSVTTEALTPGKSGKFTVTIPATNAFAYRYTIAN